MDRNTVIGFILIAGIFIIFSIMNRPSEEEAQRQQRYRDSIARVQAREAEREAARARELRREEQQQQQQGEITPDVSDSARLAAIKDEYGAFANAAVGEEEMVTIENDLVKLQITNKGGRIYSAELKDYKTYRGNPLILFSGDSTVFSINFFAQRRSISTGDLFFTSRSGQRNIVVDDKAESVSMRLTVDEGKFIEYIYTLVPESYMIDFDIRMVGLEDIIDQNISNIDLYWEILAPALERGEEAINNYSTVYYKHFQDEVEHFRGRSNKEVQEESIPTRVKWIAFKNQFFSSALIAKDHFSNAEVRSTDLTETQKYMNNFRAEIGVPFNDPNNTTIPLQFYLGPNHYNTLKKFEGLELQSLVDVGGFLSKIINRYIIIPIFNFLNNYIGNYGIIILLLTIIIKAALFPLTYRSYLSQAKMRVLKPQIDAINEKIPKEKAMERQQATMNLYRKAGVNPVGGCLPMLLQMPILIAMFRFFPASIELRQESFLWADDLSTYDAIIQWSANIPLISRFFGNHLSLFTLLMTVSTMISMRMSNTTTASSQMPGMKGMMYVMPVMFMFILNSFSAGLTYYYFLANLITIGQNAVFKRSIDEKALLKKLEAKKAKPAKKSSFQKRLEDMAKQKGYNAPKKR
jgi:YidC/Oxa1 family membrane protein insertase